MAAQTISSAMSSATTTRLFNISSHNQINDSTRLQAIINLVCCGFVSTIADNREFCLNHTYTSSVFFFPNFTDAKSFTWLDFGDSDLSLHQFA